MLFLSWWNESVSILVFVEVALGLYQDPPGRGVHQVSILVFVEVALGLHEFFREFVVNIVSILVFVEVALGPRSQR